MNHEKSSGTVELPGDFLPLPELHIGSIERKLGYFGDAPFVIFGYCVGGDEVIWKDGNSSGFGTGGWKTFLEQIVPIALRHGVDLGSISSTGTHVLLIDRGNGAVYAAQRDSAQHFLSQLYGLPPSKHPCLCGLSDCSACPSHSSPSLTFIRFPETEEHS